MYPLGQGKKMVIVGAGPVGALAAIYASKRGYNVEVYELRDGQLNLCLNDLITRRSLNFTSKFSRVL